MEINIKLFRIQFVSNFLQANFVKKIDYPQKNLSSPFIICIKQGTSETLYSFATFLGQIIFALILSYFCNTDKLFVTPSL